jgi:hypothetical protein
MAKCKRCFTDLPGKKRICEECMGKWVQMRNTAFDALVAKYGGLSQTRDQFEKFKREMKRLDRIWHKDVDKFNEEIEKLKFKPDAKLKAQ